MLLISEGICLLSKALSSRSEHRLTEGNVLSLYINIVVCLAPLGSLPGGAYFFVQNRQMNIPTKATR